MNTKVLASLVVIAAVGTVAGSTTLAEFSDTETSDNNTFTAGKLDLKLDYIATYNGRSTDDLHRTSAMEVETENGLVQGAPAVDGPVTFFRLQDVKPGDYGEVTVSLHNDNNPALVKLDFNKTLDDQGPERMECVEPEKVAQQGKCELKSDGDNSGGNPNDRGDLAKPLKLRVWRDDGDNIYEPCVVQDSERVKVDPHFYKDNCPDKRTDSGNEDRDSNGANVGERLIYPNGDNVNGRGYTGINHLQSQTWKIDGDFNPSNGWTAMPGSDGSDAYSDADGYVGIEFMLPYKTGNGVMTDRLEWSAEFSAVQARHNSDEGTQLPTQPQIPS